MANNKTRDRLMQQYGKLYSRMENCNLAECWYCNDARQTLDHCPALKHMDYMDIDKFTESGGKLTLIPACFECNAILGKKSLYSPGERLSYLYSKYMDKVEKFFSDWSEDEIEELGPSLRRAVLAKQAQVNLWIEKARKVETNILKFDASGE